MKKVLQNLNRNNSFRPVLGLLAVLILHAAIPVTLFAQNIQNQGPACTAVQSPACFNIHQDLTTSGTSGGAISFYNNGFQLLGIGLDALGLPVDQKGAAIAVRGQTSVDPIGQPQEGMAQANLAYSSGFFAQGHFDGVQGLSDPETLSNFDNTMTSTATGGYFSVDNGSGLALDGVGTYWVTGVYGELRGRVDGNPGDGRVAAVVGVDGADTGSTAPHYAGYFQGATSLNGVTYVEPGQRIQARVNGGARILGSQGNTAASPAIGFFSTNGEDDGGGGNGIFRPLANTMAFATGGKERMRITSGGLLYVKGPVRLKKVPPAPSGSNPPADVLVILPNGNVRKITSFNLLLPMEDQLRITNERVSQLEHQVLELKSLLAANTDQ